MKQRSNIFHRSLSGTFAVALAIAGVAQGSAQEASKPAAAPKPAPATGPAPAGNPFITPSSLAWREDPSPGVPDLAPRHFVIKRAGVFEGRPLRYSVVSEDQVMRNTRGEPTGSIFSFSYIKDPTPGETQRPVVFIWNGGPGSASFWLHMSVLGPRRVDFRDLTPSQVPPFRLVDNPDSPLAVADLVFMDPVGTGFSRYWGKGGAKDFYGREEDAAATVSFINAWLRKHGRWNSPKFILGESYGTTRAALVSRRLMGGVLDGTFKGVSLNGVVLLGGDGGLSNPPGNDRHLLTFTTMAATAWYHDRVEKAGRTFDQFIAEADRFAKGEYLAALNKGDALDAGAKAEIARRTASYIGLSPAYLESKNLRVSPAEFEAQLLADRGLVVGHYDGRYVLPAQNSLGDPVADDAAMGQYSAAFLGGLNHYVRDELGVRIDEDYIAIDWINVNLPFNHGTPKVPAATAFNVGEGDPGADLAAMLRRNPDLRLLTLEGWFDEFGAVGTADYGVRQRNLPAGQVTQRAYFSGHMPYVGEAAPKMAADLKAFIRLASGQSVAATTAPAVRSRRTARR